MRMNLSRLGFQSALVLALAGAAALQAKPQRLLPDGAVDVTKLLPAPAAADSVEARAELDVVRQMQAARTPADIARAQAEDKGLTIFSFADVVGPWFTADNCPETAKLFASVEADAKAAAKVGKTFWNRPRPPYASSDIHPVTVLEQEGSYPSSHGTRAEAYAQLLGDLMPPLRPALEQRAQQIGWDRVIAGVHYPSDVQAGRTLGLAIANALRTNPAYLEAAHRVSLELAPHAPTTQP